LDRHGIDKSDPNAVQYVIEDVRYLMEYGCGFRTKSNNMYSDCKKLWTE